MVGSFLNCMGVLLEEVVAEAGLWVWPLLDSHHFPPERVDYAGGEDQSPETWMALHLSVLMVDCNQHCSQR